MLSGCNYPLAAMTADLGLYMRLRLPEPWHGATNPIPLILYGASGVVGAYAIKLAQVSNIHPIIAVAGRGEAYVEKLISRNKGDVIIDYRQGDKAVISGIKEALKKAGASEVRYAFDAVSEKNSYQNICEVLSKDGKIVLVLPSKEYKEIPESIRKSVTEVESTHFSLQADSPEAKVGIKTGPKEFAYAYFRLFTKGLQDGWFSPHPYEVVPGGLNGIEGLKNLQAGKASAVKYVYRIADTK
jgi:NADPH:quinone reductase